MSFGGGGSQSVTQEFKPPSYTVDPWKNYVSNAQNLAGQGLTPYQGSTVANLSPMTGTGLQMLGDYATEGTPERWAGGQAVVNAATGGAQNPYSGVNPYLSQMIDSSNQKITDMYRKGTAAQTDAQYARGGAYGGSGYADAVSTNQQNLLSGLAANTNSMLGQNYNQSAQLQEGDLNRRLQAAGIGQGQQGIDASAIQQLLGGGQIGQNYEQQLLDANRNLYQQNQQAPFTLSDYLGSALSRASGGQGSNTQTSNGGGMSPWLAGLGGLGLLSSFG